MTLKEALERFKTKDGRAIKVGSQSYYVLCALLEGKKIDDYFNPPKKPNGVRIFNIRSRIADLEKKYGVPIGRIKSEEGNFKQYFFDYSKL